MNQLFLVPSVYTHLINGLLLVLSFILLCNNYSKIKAVDSYKMITLVLIFSIAIGIHGLSHMGLEKMYNYKPWKLLL